MKRSLEQLCSNEIAAGGMEKWMLTVAIIQLLKGCYSSGGHWLLSVSIPSSFYLKSVVASTVLEKQWLFRFLHIGMGAIILEYTEN